MSGVPINSARAAEINESFSATKALDPRSFLQGEQTIIFNDNYSWNLLRSVLKTSKITKLSKKRNKIQLLT